MRLAWALLSALCVGVGLALLYLFVTIYLEGRACGVEPNPWILWAETIGLAAIVLFGLYMFAALLRKG